MTDSLGGAGQVTLSAVLCVDEGGDVSWIRNEPVFAGADPAAGRTGAAAPRERRRPADAEPRLLSDDVAEQVRDVLAEAGLSTPALRRDLARGRVVVIQISPTSYLGLTGYRRQIHTLRIDDCLFLFSPPQLSKARLAALVAALAELQTSKSPVGDLKEGPK